MFLDQENFDSPNFFPGMPKTVQGPKKTKNGCSFSMVMSYTDVELMEKRFQKIRKNQPAQPTSCPTQELVLGPKMTSD